MSDDQISTITRRLDTQDKLLGEIHGALVGNGALGNSGLVNRIAHLEKGQERLNKDMTKWAGVVTGGVFVLQFVKSKLFG